MEELLMNKREALIHSISFYQPEYYQIDELEDLELGIFDRTTSLFIWNKSNLDKLSDNQL